MLLISFHQFHKLNCENPFRISHSINCVQDTSPLFYNNLKFRVKNENIQGLMRYLIKIGKQYIFMYLKGYFKEWKHIISAYISSQNWHTMLLFENHVKKRPVYIPQRTSFPEAYNKKKKILISDIKICIISNLSLNNVSYLT